jgi:16S rRNA (adenine1518-N6/adenine1519-N6)-dimethyltransferase
VLALLEEVESLLEMRFMVQLEVAQRMAAYKGTKDYGSYTILVRLLAKVRIAHKVSPQVFEPPPSVWSAVVAMERREIDRGDYERAKALVFAAFRSRRKRLVNNLPKGLRMGTAEALRSMGYGPGVRAEELVPEDFVTLSRLLSRAA